MAVPWGAYVHLWGVKQWIKFHLDKAVQEPLRQRVLGEMGPGAARGRNEETRGPSCALGLDGT